LVNTVQVVKVICQQAVSPPQMNGSVVIARWRQCAPHLTHAFMGPVESKSQTASQSVQPFLHCSSWQTVATLYSKPPLFPLKIAAYHDEIWTHIKYIVCWAHLSPQPKWHFDRFSRFCTAHRRVSLYFTTGCPFLPQNCPSRGGSGPHLIYDSFGQSEPTTQTTSRSVHSFFVQLTAECLYTLQSAALPPQNCPFP